MYRKSAEQKVELYRNTSSELNPSQGEKQQHEPIRGHLNTARLSECALYGREEKVTRCYRKSCTRESNNNNKKKVSSVKELQLSLT